MPASPRVMFLQISETFGILSAQFRMLADSMTTPTITDPDYRQKRLNEVGHLKIESLELSVRATNCLKNNGIETVADLEKFNKRELKRFYALGAKSIAEIAETMFNLGLPMRGFDFGKQELSL